MRNPTWSRVLGHRQRRSAFLDPVSARESETSCGRKRARQKLAKTIMFRIARNSGHLPGRCKLKTLSPWQLRAVHLQQRRSPFPVLWCTSNWCRVNSELVLCRVHLHQAGDQTAWASYPSTANRPGTHSTARLGLTGSSYSRKGSTACRLARSHQVPARFIFSM
eukprot:3932528-Rhodomonas_salina.3